jgi:hypothetical protein
MPSGSLTFSVRQTNLWRLVSGGRFSTQQNKLSCSATSQEPSQRCSPQLKGRCYDTALPVQSYSTLQEAMIKDYWAMVGWRLEGKPEETRVINLLRYYVVYHESHMKSAENELETLGEKPAAASAIPRPLT